MATTTFIDNQTVIFADWLNDTNNAVYNGIFAASSISPANLVCNGSVSGSGFTSLVNNGLSAPGPIGSATPNTGVFTTLNATSSLTLNSVAVSTISGTQTLTNKTLTSPIINSATISSPTITGTPVISASLITSGTAQNTTSGTTITFTGIPSWAKRIIVMFNGVQTSGSSIPIIQIGSGSITTSGYTSAGSVIAASGVASSSQTIGFPTAGGVSDTSSTTRYGSMTINLVTGNTWVANSVIADSSNGFMRLGGGGLTLSGALDRIQLNTVNGTDTFTSGSINIQYE
jgi:trimeric autotransporter adhesin